MSKIKEAFKNGKAFIPFITGGDPDLETTKKLIIEMIQEMKNERFLRKIYFFVKTMLETERSL